MAVDKLEVDEAVSSAGLNALGERLRAVRQLRGWTLEALALRSKLSKSYLSRLEDGERQPSIAALLSLSRALGVSLGRLLGDEPHSQSRAAVVRGLKVPAAQGNGLFYQAHSGRIAGALMQPMRVTIPADRSGEELYSHEGEEWLYVLSGELSVTLGEEEHKLGAGDSIYFHATVGHRLTAQGGRDVEAILVASVAPPALLSSYL